VSRKAEEQKHELEELINRILIADTLNTEEAISLNYKLRKLVERLLGDDEHNPQFVNIYYLLGDNYRTILRDLSEGVQQLRLIGAKILSLLE